MTINLVGATAEQGAKQAEHWAHAEGLQTVASSQAAHAEGNATTASGAYSHAEGWSTKATNMAAHAGGTYATSDGYAGWARGSINPSGQGIQRCQFSIYTLGIMTASTASATLTMDTGAPNVTAGSANVVVLPLGATYVFELSISARRSGQSAAWLFSGAIARDTTGTTRILGAVAQVGAWADTTLGTPAITANASAYLQIAVTPQAVTTTFWHAVLQVNEIAYNS